MSKYDITSRELLMIQYVSNGYTSKEIAAMEGVGESTVNTHLDSARWKMHAENRTHLIAICLRNKFIK